MRHPESTYAVDVQDIEYLSHQGTSMLARVFRPRGSGPFPTLVEIHGGAWYTCDRTLDSFLNEPLAKMGNLVVAIDFRMPPRAPYPASLADINYAIRWVKANAKNLDTDPDMVGVMGSSSGGHQAVLAAMRPRDPRYGAMALPHGAASLNAKVRFAVALWPVIHPLGRYRYAKGLQAEGENPNLTDVVLPGHEQNWRTEDEMAEADPVLILERGEQVELPPVLCVQSPSDVAHPFSHVQRFASLYRSAGGRIDLELPEGSPLDFLRNDLTGVASVRVLERISKFVHENVR